MTMPIGGYRKPEVTFKMEGRAIVISVDGRPEIMLPVLYALELCNFLNANLRGMRPDKNWDKCSLSNHSDNCECGGNEVVKCQPS